KSYDSFIGIVIFLVVLFNFISQSLVYFLDVSTITWRWWYQLVVENQDSYYNSVISAEEFELVLQRKQVYFVQKLHRYRYWRMIVPEFCTKILATIVAKLDIWLHLENVNKRRLLSKPLTMMPHLSTKLRTRLWLFIILFDKFCLLSQALIAILFTGFFISIAISYPYLAVHPWYSYVWLLLEVFLIFYCLV